MIPRIARALAVQDYVARHPVVDSASIIKQDDNSIVVTARLSTTSFKIQDKKYYSQIFFISKQDGGEQKVHESPMVPVSGEVKMSTLPLDAKWTVNFRALTVNDKKKRIIEIIHAETGVYDEVEVTETHADFLSGEHWGNPVWLENERIVVYVAEQHSPNWKDEDKPYTAYAYAPNFGEQLSGQTRPGLFLLDFSRDDDTRVTSIDPLQQDQALAETAFRQPALAPRKSASDPIQLFATGSSLLPDGRRLGSIYCCNRPDAIYQFTIQYQYDNREHPISKPKRISSLDRSARYARVVTGSKGLALVYVSNRRGYEHASCATLHKRSLPSGDDDIQHEEDILVNTVGKPSSPGDFPGLYPSRATVQCMGPSSDSSQSASGQACFVLVESAWGSRTTIVAVNLEDGSVHDQGSDDITSYRLLCANDQGQILAVRSSTISPPEFLLGTFTATPQPKTQWHVVKRSSYEFSSKHFVNTTKLYSTIVPLPNRNDAEAIVISGYPMDKLKLPGVLHTSPIPGLTGSATSSSELPPLCTVPHGGPNGQYSSTWNFFQCLAWVAAGYTVALVNYPGSLGYGQDTIEELSGDCGNLEVRTTVELKKYLTELNISTDEKGKRMYLGGSHSGFMGAHISVRYPKEFDAIDLRNPVIDLPSMFATSDIPEWTMNQLNLNYDFKHPPAFVPAEVHDELCKRSPSYYAQKLFAANKEPCLPPTQLQLGASDLRVPSNQGKAWYHCLKGHGEEVNMLFFPDNGHPLEKVWTQRKSFHAQLEFLVKHSRFE